MHWGRSIFAVVFSFADTAAPEMYTLSLVGVVVVGGGGGGGWGGVVVQLITLSPYLELD